MMILPCAFWPLAEHAEFGQNCFDASIGAVSVCIYDSMPIDACLFKPSFPFHRIVGSYQMFYREAGEQHVQTLVLLHGFPSSSHMFRNLLPVLGERFHVVAPDYPGYGYSESPSVEQFAYTFDHLEEIVEKVLDALQLKRFSLYVQDYGAPVGFRLAVKHPERFEAIISQNGNAYSEGLTSFWETAWPFWSHRTAETEKPIRGLFTREA